MKKFLLAIILVALALPLTAAHIIGGELRYEYIGPGAAPNTKRFKIILLLFKGDASGGSVAPLAPSYVVGIFNNDNGAKVPGASTFSDWVITQDVPPGILPVPIQVSSCIDNPPTLAYTYARYSFEVELPDNNNGYTLAYQTCCRQTGMQNVNPTGANYTCVIPGTSQLGSAAAFDNSPQYQMPVSVICQNSPFTLDFSATDIDGDSLVYTFCNAYDGGAAVDAGFEDPAPPPYNSVGYIAPYSGTVPLGIQANINSATGLISGTSPAAGNYVLAVCVRAYRDGRLLTTHRKDLMVKISPCNPIRAVPDPGYITCDGFNIQFDHNSSGANTVFWDFGVDTSSLDTSTLDNPVYVYGDTGIYNVKFVINRGESCADSSIIQMGIYPGFFPGFESQAPYCAGIPVQFNDTSLTRYGVIDSWTWDFGDSGTTNDTSSISNPRYIYPAAGNYTVKLTVTNSKGCEKTVERNITVLASPTLNLLSPDTTYCGLDSIVLRASGSGNYSWTPNINIINRNTATPTVFPASPTTYTVTLEQAGCRRTDTVRVVPVFDFENFIAASPATICQEDTLILTGTANRNNVTWRWAPTGSVASPSSRITRAFPMATTNYSLISTWGRNCISQKQVTIPVTPLAVPFAGPDTAYCLGGAGVGLQASGGTSYQWSPTTGLSNAGIANPVATPVVTTNYVVSVGVDGCSKRKMDTVRVLPRQKPQLQLTNDTLICIIDTLRLNAAGAGTIRWTPDYNINSLTSHTPLVSPDTPTKYFVRLTDIFRCFKDDSVFVDVRPDVTVDAGPDTTICKGDTMHLATTGDAVSYSWTPFRAISDTTAKNPVVRPDTTTTYVVRANIGKCEKQSRVTIRVVPYPVAVAGPDTTLCSGFSTRLQASGGSSYSWWPETYLSNPTVANPMVVNPAQTRLYTVTVTDTLGCPKPVKDSILVTVIPPLNVRIPYNDTALVDGQSIVLAVSGAISYQWSPNQWLSSSTIPNPTAKPRDNIVYHVVGSDENGCMARDSISITLYDIPYGMHVPTAFTPNGDGNNDIARPILLGMKSLSYFNIFNRFGQLVFSTTEQGKGWDGIYKGKPQDPATFVWMAEGVSFKGEKITRKGYVVLIR